MTAMRGGPAPAKAGAGLVMLHGRGSSARDMFDAVKGAVRGSDVFISVAAVADWRVRKTFQSKIKKLNGAPPTLEFTENPDILAWVAKQKNAPFCVGFAAESERVARNAREKRARKGIPLIAANLAQQALGADENAITLFDRKGAHPLGRGPKLELARRLVAHVATMIPKKGAG